MHGKQLELGASNMRGGGTGRARPSRYGTAIGAATALALGVLTVAAPPAAAQAERFSGDRAQASFAAGRPGVTLTVVRTAPVGARVALTGSTRPDRARQQVQLQRKIGGSWRPVATRKLTRHSAYTFKRRLPTVGTTRFRVVVPRQDGMRRVVSPRRGVRVSNPGYDASYPQCDTALPANAAFGVVGVDGGRPFEPNPCLPRLIAWATASGVPAYYVNTANPGPLMSTFWPAGQATPRPCAATYPENDSADCSYDYGWNAAADSYARATAAAASVAAPAVATATWWLDVETGNTWESELYGQSAPYLANDAAVLLGMADYLRSQGVAQVGVYSTVKQWQIITGGAGLASAPVWYAGVGSASSAAARCSPANSFTGGRVLLAQYAKSGFDANHRC